MRLAQEADAERQPLGICDSRAGVGERVHIVADLADVVRTVATVRGFEGEHVAERCLRAFDLRGDDRLLADESVKEPVGARHHRPRYGKSGQRGHGGGMELGGHAGQGQRRIDRRKRVGDERAHLFSEGAGDAVLTSLASHGCEAPLSCASI